MKPRKRHLTARIKQETKHALMAQLAAAADTIIVQRRDIRILTCLACGALGMLVGIAWGAL